MSNKTGDLRVWWIPQVPGKPFTKPVKSIEEAILLLTTLAEYDMFQLEHNIKPDFCNAGGLCVFEDEDCDDGDDGWSEWYHDDGRDIDDLIRDRAQ